LNLATRSFSTAKKKFGSNRFIGKSPQTAARGRIKIK
jgi:hypothetical protein